MSGQNYLNKGGKIGYPFSREGQATVAWAMTCKRLKLNPGSTCLRALTFDQSEDAPGGDAAGAVKSRIIQLAKTQKPQDIDGYISQFPADVQAILEQVRETISHAAPDAKEVISYQSRLQEARHTGLLWQRGKNTLGCTRRSPATRPLRKQSHGTLGRRAISSSRLRSRSPST